MKKFITVVPLQKEGQLRRSVYQAVGNSRLQMDTAVSYPILTALHGYLEPEEPSRMIALGQDTEDGRRNFRILQEQLAEVCAERKLVMPELEWVEIGKGDKVATHVDTFQKLIDHVDDDDELFACMTFGTKPVSQAVLMAVQYAYRIKRNASISCILYGGVDRSESQDAGLWSSLVYDETALVQLDEIVRLLADRGVANPREAIRQILSL